MSQSLADLWPFWQPVPRVRFNLNIFLLNFQAGVFMGFSITSAVFGGIIIIFYGMQINFNRGIRENYNCDQRDLHDTQMAISAIILTLGIAEFAI